MLHWINSNKENEMDKVQRAASIARMGTDTLAGLNKIDHIIELFKVGLVTADEAIRMF